MPARRKSLFIAAVILLAAFTFAVPTAEARKPNEYENIVRHLKAKYQAKKVSIPFLWLAKFAVKVVRPAGVKSFSLTMFEDLKFSAETLDKEMQAAMRDSFGPEWTSVFRVRARDGQQAYMYMREAGKNVKLTLVTIDKNQAAVVRATFSPERLAEFVNDPKIFGISLRNGEEANENKQLDRK
ncbi:MAG TPA: hypothetical protein VNA17_08670 [Pyrinomonadaceae bacterium]|nr:hypothetical protein [Pyrinomonadaceae bacterium]